MLAIISLSSQSLGGSIGLFSDSFVVWWGALEMRREALSVVHLGKAGSRSVMGASVWVLPRSTSMGGTMLESSRPTGMERRDGLSE